jgi:DNA-binding XRE family transcriptional regulator
MKAIQTLKQAKNSWRKEILALFDQRGVSHENIFWTSLFEAVEQGDIKGNPPEQWKGKDLEAIKTESLRVLKIVNQDLQQKVVNDPQKFSAIDRKEWGRLLKDRENKLRDLFRQFNHHALKVPQSNRPAYWDGIRAESRRYENSGAIVGANLPTDRWQLDGEALNQIKSASLSDKWVSASSQELMRTIDDRIARGRFQNDPNVSQYPSTDVSTNRWKGHAEIRPLDTEQEENEIPIPESSLVEWAKEMAKALERRGVRVSDASKVLVSLWWEKQQNGWAHISLDDICEKMGQKRRSGRLDGYEPRVRDMIRESIEQAARIKVFLRDLPDTLRGKNKKRQMSDVFINIATRISPQNDTLPNPSGLPKQGELWGREKWDSIIVQPGLITQMALNEYGRQSMLMPKPLFALDDHRFRSAKLLGTKLAEQFRIKVKEQSQSHFFRVTTLLGYADIELDPKSEAKLQKDLDTLASKTIGLIKGYRFENELRDLMAVSGGVRVNEKILNKWKEVMVEIEMADDISWEYAKIAPSAPPPIPILNNELLARQLRQAREDAGLSIARLSELLGISQGTVSNIEHGGKVRHSTEQKVRKWLNEPQNLNA